MVISNFLTGDKFIILLFILISSVSFSNSYGAESPHSQIWDGVAPFLVQCDASFKLVLKTSDHSPACVKESHVEKLVNEYGWGVFLPDYKLSTTQAQSDKQVQLSSGSHTHEINLFISNIPNINETATITAQYRTLEDDAQLPHDDVVMQIFLPDNVDLVVSESENIRTQLITTGQLAVLWDDSFADRSWHNKTITIKPTQEGDYYIYGTSDMSGHTTGNSDISFRVAENNSYILERYQAPLEPLEIVCFDDYVPIMFNGTNSKDNTMSVLEQQVQTHLDDSIVNNTKLTEVQKKVIETISSNYEKRWMLTLATNPNLECDPNPKIGVSISVQNPMRIGEVEIVDVTLSIIKPGRYASFEFVDLHLGDGLKLVNGHLKSGLLVSHDGKHVKNTLVIKAIKEGTWDISATVRGQTQKLPVHVFQ